MSTGNTDREQEEIKNLLEQYRKELSGKDSKDIIRWALNTFGINNVVQVTSLQAGGQVITDMLMNINSGARVITIDTGRLFQETYNTMEETMKKYSMKYEIFHPSAKDVETLTSSQGPNLFYTNPENRKKCCEIRKTLPLRRALATAEAWFTGLRKDQSAARQNVEVIEWDEKFNMFKINPLSEWKDSDVWNYIAEHSVPYNELHMKGYPSIGCMPCTRAVAEGDDPRAGRWWWEESSKKECGIHIKDGKIVRISKAEPKDDRLNRLDRLESRSIAILRESKRDIKKMCLLWSISKDTSVLIHLIRKAFFGSVPFPLVHFDTGVQVPGAAEYRDMLALESKWEMIKSSKTETESEIAVNLNNSHDFACNYNMFYDILKKVISGDYTLYTLNHTSGTYEIEENNQSYSGLITGIRSDDSHSYSHQSHISPIKIGARDEGKQEISELGNLLKTDFAPGTHSLIQPLLDWSELDIWEYIEREKIKIFNLYFDQGNNTRYKSLGNFSCSTPVRSCAVSVKDIIQEIKNESQQIESSSNSRQRAL